MPTAEETTIDANLAVIRSIDAQNRMAAYYSAVDCAYNEESIFNGVTCEDIADSSESFVSESFGRLLKSEDWKSARATFAGALMVGDTVAQAMQFTLNNEGIY